MATIPLTKGFTAWVDDDDFPRLSQFKWHAVFMRGRVYAKRMGPRPARHPIYMHREILGASPGRQVDHKVHRHEECVVDNRRENLRLATNGLNQANTAKGARPRITSRFKGVSRMRKKWKASIQVGCKHYHLGHHDSEVIAAMIYDIRAVAAFGEFAVCNFGVPGAQRWLFSGSGA